MYQQPRSLLVGNIKIKQDLILTSAEDIVSLVTYLLSLNVYMYHNSFKFKVSTNIEIIFKIKDGSRFRCVNLTVVLLTRYQF